MIVDEILDIIKGVVAKSVYLFVIVPAYTVYLGCFYNWTSLYGRSVVEEEEERGVAHIVEHLAFSATNKYTNHDIIKFLESDGAEFGACQNAVTSSDETVYELFVPVDKPEVLPQAISILAEFSSEVIVTFWFFI